MVEVVGADISGLSEDEVKRIIEEVLKGEKKEGNFVVSFVGEETMENLNRQFLGREGPTDVLSFPYGDEDVSGEIVVCPDVVRRYAEEEGKGYVERLVLTLVHGALHLCGYDHERSDEKAEEMFKKQREYTRAILEVLER